MSRIGLESMYVAAKLTIFPQLAWDIFSLTIFLQCTFWEKHWDGLVVDRWTWQLCIHIESVTLSFQEKWRLKVCDNMSCVIVVNVYRVLDVLTDRNWIQCSIGYLSLLRSRVFKSWMFNWEGWVGKHLWNALSYYSSICLDELRKATEYLCWTSKLE